MRCREDGSSQGVGCCLICYVGTAASFNGSAIWALFSRRFLIRAIFGDQTPRPHKRGTTEQVGTTSTLESDPLDEI